MRHAIRSLLGGLILAQPAPSLAQHYGQGGGLGLAIVGNGSYGSRSTYHPGQLGVIVPYFGGSAGVYGGLPANQAGPGGLMLPHDPVDQGRPRVATANLRRVDP